MKKELNSKTNSKKEKISLDALEMISGGTGPNEMPGDCSAESTE